MVLMLAQLKDQHGKHRLNSTRTPFYVRCADPRASLAIWTHGKSVLRQKRPTTPLKHLHRKMFGEVL